MRITDVAPYLVAVFHRYDVAITSTIISGIGTFAIPGDEPEQDQQQDVSPTTRPPCVAVCNALLACGATTVLIIGPEKVLVDADPCERRAGDKDI